MRKLIVDPALAAVVRPGARVLDLGGFDGSMTQHLVERGAHVTVVDLDEVGLESARRRGLAGVVGSATEIPFPARSFDVVVCCDLMVCIPLEGDAREQVFREIARVLTPTGRLIMTVPDPELQLPFVDMAAAYTSWRSTVGMTRAGLDEVTARAGLKIVERREYFGLPSRLFYALAFWHNLPSRGTRLKRTLWRYVVAGEAYWCPAPQAHLIVGEPVARPVS
jgi:SAM-dependent methyltransferase